MLIEAKVKDLGSGFQVARYLPAIKKRSVGPFVFLDEMGPVISNTNTKLDVRPHPHIGLSTVTYLLAGEGLHRDSLGSEQVIRPGDINLMTAGRGITHSERTREAFLNQPEADRVLHGLQFWLALPKELEQCPPAFEHYPKNLFSSYAVSPEVDVRVLMGSALGFNSPVKTFFKTLFLDISISKKVEWSCDLEVDEYALLEMNSTPSTQCLVNNTPISKGILLYSEGSKLTVSTDGPTRLLLFGGVALPEPRHMWWNFVATEKELIREAAKRWDSQQFPKVPGETDFIPLPKDPLP